MYKLYFFLQLDSFVRIFQNIWWIIKMRADTGTRVCVFLAVNCFFHMNCPLFPLTNLVYLKFTPLEPITCLSSATVRSGSLCHFLSFSKSSRAWVTIPFTHSHFSYFNICKEGPSYTVASQLLYLLNSKEFCLHLISAINFWGYTQMLSSLIRELMQKSTFQEPHSN